MCPVERPGSPGTCDTRATRTATHPRLETRMDDVTPVRGGYPRELVDLRIPLRDGSEALLCVPRPLSPEDLHLVAEACRTLLLLYGASLRVGPDGQPPPEARPEVDEVSGVRLTRLPRSVWESTGGRVLPVDEDCHREGGP